jgi:hypothetical protein
VWDWTREKLIVLAATGLCGFVFKSRSPSCGVRNVKIFAGPGSSVRSGAGIFASAFREEFPLIPVEEEDRLRDPSLRMSFLARVLAFGRRRDSARKRGKACLFCIP